MDDSCINRSYRPVITSLKVHTHLRWLIPSTLSLNHVLAFSPRYMAVSAMRSRSRSGPVKWLIFNHRRSECSQPSNCSMSSSPEYFSGRGTRNDEGLIPLDTVFSGILTCSSINRIDDNFGEYFVSRPTCMGSFHSGKLARV